LEVEIIEPNVSSFIKSLRDIGYTFEIAVADILDNSISANAKNIEIHVEKTPYQTLCILDDGDGMNEDTLREAMRISTIDPDAERDSNDLGRFSLGLKTASYSQCKLLTVISKSNSSEIYAKQWDLDKVSNLNKWALNSLNEGDIKELFSSLDDSSLMERLKELNSGTLVVWQKLDRFEDSSLSRKLTELREHLSLVFHRFLEGTHKSNKVNISINGKKLIPFNPFYKSTAKEKDTFYSDYSQNKKVTVKGHVLPSYSSKETNPEEYSRYATSDGYSRSQGCYLYRANRIISYASWWRIVKSQDANQLVRFEIDISNDQDKEWGITVTKSGFGITPPAVIRDDLRIKFKNVIRTGRGIIVGRKINNKSHVRLWQLFRNNDKQNSFVVNKDHPLLLDLKSKAGKEFSKILDVYLHSLEAYMPVKDITREQINNPIDFKEAMDLEKKELNNQIKKFISQGLSKEEIEFLVGSEGFDEEVFKNE
jgi:hypothetical protein